MKSMLAEITDPSNIAQAYAFMPIAWSTGATLGCVGYGRHRLNCVTNKIPALSSVVLCPDLPNVSLQYSAIVHS